MNFNEIERGQVAGSVPKIKDVARVAGVSTATVSRTLNQPDSVAEKTRKAVLAAAEKTGYRVNQAARSLRSQRTGAVVVLVPNLGNPFFSQILAGIESTLAEERLSVLVVDTLQQFGKERLFLDYMNRSRADGVISLDGSLSTQLLGRGQAPGNPLPIVFACEWHEQDIAPSVRVNNRRGAAMAVTYLRDLGHEKIGFLQGPRGNVLSDAREDGFKTAVQELGFVPQDQWMFSGDFSIESGIRAAEAWLQLKDRPTAIFCANDESAMGLISKFYETGVSVPDEVSVIGFDDIELSQHFIPPLTTIGQPRKEIGVSAAHMLINQMKQPSPGSVSQPLQEILPVELIVRKTTGPVA